MSVQESQASEGVISTLDQRVLLDILAELGSQGKTLDGVLAKVDIQTRTITKMNRAVQIISLILFLSVLLGCILGILSGPAILLP